MSTTKDPKKVTKPIGRRYTSVSAMMMGEGMPVEIQNAVEELAQETRVTRRLAAMRVEAALSQQEMADRLGCTQSCISKWESGRDEDLTFQIVRDYAKITKKRVGVNFGEPMNHAESVKAHVLCIRDRLLALAKLATDNRDLEADIQNFFGEAALNIMSILSRCQQEMPHTSGGEFQVRIQLMNDPELRKRRLQSAQQQQQIEDFAGV